MLFTFTQLIFPTRYPGSGCCIWLSIPTLSWHYSRTYGRGIYFCVFNNTTLVDICFVLLHKSSILISENGEPLIDNFGLSKIIAEVTTAFVGRCRYLAPELTDTGNSNAYNANEEQFDTDMSVTKQTDVFAFGMVALEVSWFPFLKKFLQCSWGASLVYVLRGMTLRAT